MLFVDNLSPEESLALTSLIAVAFSEDKNPEEIIILGTFIVQVGSAMLAIAAQQRYLESLAPKSNTPQ